MACVGPVMDHEFRCNIFKVAVDPQAIFDYVMTKFIVNNRTEA